MLAHRLRSPLAYQLVHPIGVCVCGILSNLIAIMKLFRESKSVIKLRKVDQREALKRDTDSQQQQIISYGADGSILAVVDVARDPSLDMEGSLDYEGRQHKRYQPRQVQEEVKMNRRLEFHSQSRVGSASSLLKETL